MRDGVQAPSVVGRVFQRLATGGLRLRELARLAQSEGVAAQNIAKSGRFGGPGGQNASRRGEHAALVAREKAQGVRQLQAKKITGVCFKPELESRRRPEQAVVDCLAQRLDLRAFGTGGRNTFEGPENFSVPDARRLAGLAPGQQDLDETIEREGGKTNRIRVERVEDGVGHARLVSGEQGDRPFDGGGGFRASGGKTGLKGARHAE